MGSVALTVLMIPIVIRSSEEILKIVPNHLREASYALGTPKWKTITKVVLPTALAGLVTGIMLAIARIVGETAPLLVTTGVIDSMNANPFDGWMQNLAVYAFNEYRIPACRRSHIRPRLDGGDGPDPDRDVPQPGRAVRLPALRDGDPLSSMEEERKRMIESTANPEVASEPRRGPRSPLARMPANRRPKLGSR